MYKQPLECSKCVFYDCGCQNDNAIVVTYEDIHGTHCSDAWLINGEGDVKSND